MREVIREHTLHSRGGKSMETRLLPRTTKPMEGNPKDKWTSLIHHLNEDFLKVCFQRLKRDAASGVDGVTVREDETNLEDNIRDLVARMKAWKYYPQSVRRVYIPKADGSKRPLGIPAVEDKIMQMGMKLTGHYRYYGISGNMQTLRLFYTEASKLAYKWINRRSQKKSYNYAEYCL